MPDDQLDPAATAQHDLAHRFTYHPPEPEQIEVFGLLRDVGYHMALVIVGSTRPSREQALALTKVEEAVMHANSSIARHGLADPAYAGAADLHDLVLDQLAGERPTSPLVSQEPAWQPVLGVPGTQAREMVSFPLERCPVPEHHGSHIWDTADSESWCDGHQLAVTDVTEEAPHSRACGITRHKHGTACSANCPTCHGNAL